MRVLAEEEEEDDFYSDYSDEEEAEEFDDDDEDIYYDQGYDWVQSGSDTDDEGGIYDNFYDADGIIEESWMSDSTQQKMSENEARQRADKEAFKLKNLKRKVQEMERRGEI